MRRSQSLRTRVAIAAALGAAVIVAVTYAVLLPSIARSNVDQLDRRLATAAKLVGTDSAAAAESTIGSRKTSELSLTIRSATKKTVTGVELPPISTARATVTVDGAQYRVLSVHRPRKGDVVELGLPLDESTAATTRERRLVLLSGLLAVAGAGLLGWILGGRALRPIARLTSWVRAHPQDTHPQHGRPPHSGVREADELSDAIASLNQRTGSALTTARDFASAAVHELRTPLTAMRTNLDVLRTHELQAEDRHELLADVDRAQRRIESTLTALEQLAMGELATRDAMRPTDLADLCDLAAGDASRTGLAVDLDVDPDLVITGFPAGLRLLLDNALTNAKRHGKATSATISAHRIAADHVVLTIDDNGSGVPEAERAAVFERFARGSTAAAGGSGLGLALVAQQAALHGGTAHFETSRLGGARLVVDLKG